MFMHDANRCATAVWTHRVFASIARSDGCNDVADLAGALAQAPWWEGCLAAAVERYRVCDRDVGSRWHSEPRRAELELALR